MIARVVDIETTGMDPREGAEVIELGWQDVDPVARVRVRGSTSILYNCPPEVLAVHHILPADLANREFFDLARADVSMCVVSAAPAQYYVAHNAEFEQQFLGGWSDPEYQTPAPEWICTYKCALRVWPDAPSHGNQALMYWLGLHETLDARERHPPHRAGPDAYVTAAILCKLLEHASIEQMVQWSREPRMLPTCPIGKFRGKRWPDVEAGFLTWMLRQPDMAEDLKWNAQRELDRRRGY